MFNVTTYNPSTPDTSHMTEDASHMTDNQYNMLSCEIT